MACVKVRLQHLLRWGKSQPEFEFPFFEFVDEIRSKYHLDSLDHVLVSVLIVRGLLIARLSDVIFHPLHKIRLFSFIRLRGGAFHKIYNNYSGRDETFSVILFR